MAPPLFAPVLVRVSSNTSAGGMDTSDAAYGLQSEKEDMLPDQTDEGRRMDEGMPVEPGCEASPASIAGPTRVLKKLKTRRARPIIDLDEHVRKAEDPIKQARKQVQTARMHAKLEKRKKQRLMRKASSLNVDDLERIAVLNRCGLIQAAHGLQSGEGAAGTSAPSTAA